MPVPATLTRTDAGTAAFSITLRHAAVTRSARCSAPASDVSGSRIWNRASATLATRSVARESCRMARAIGPAMVRIHGSTESSERNGFSSTTATAAGRL